VNTNWYDTDTNIPRCH